jgi:hypothetical protein
MGLIVSSSTITLHFLARVSVTRTIFSFQSNEGEGGDLRGSVINLLKFNGILIFGTNVCAVFLCLMR